jgi:mRNA interferase HigB
VRIISRRTLNDFAASLTGTKDYQAVESALEAWAEEVDRAEWNNSAELREQFRSASIVGDRVVFNIKGNSYRLVIGVNYTAHIVFVKWFGTHAEYDKIDVRTVRHER